MEERSWQGPTPTLKTIVRDAVPPTLLRRIKSAMGRVHFDEVTLVHDIIGGEPGVMMDVGAHYGAVTSMFAASGWRVIAFEPDNANRAMFKSAVRPRPSITLRDEAVSDEGGKELAFFASDVSSGISTLSSFHDSHVQRQTVRTTTVAEMTRHYGIDRLDFLKIDTEGHDLFVLKGVDWSAPPGAIVCEFEDRKTQRLGYSLPDMVAFLREAGYAVTISEWFPIVEYGITHRWRRFTEEPQDVAPDAWGNLIAFRNGTAPPLAELERRSRTLFGGR